MAQEFSINLDDLQAYLGVREGGRFVCYTINLESDRSSCLIERAVFEVGGPYETKRGDPIECAEALLTLDQLRSEAPHDVAWAKQHHVVWAARGMWGIPLEFGSRPPQDLPLNDPGDTAESN